jgi:hypothetical protein
MWSLPAPFSATVGATSHSAVMIPGRPQQWPPQLDCQLPPPMRAPQWPWQESSSPTSYPAALADATPLPCLRGDAGGLVTTDSGVRLFWSTLPEPNARVVTRPGRLAVICDNKRQVPIPVGVMWTGLLSLHNGRLVLITWVLRPRSQQSFGMVGSINSYDNKY